MKHLRSLTRIGPQAAQLESLLQLVGLLSSILQLAEDLREFLKGAE